MARTRRRDKRRSTDLPANVRAHGNGYQPHIYRDGKRTYGPTFATPGEAAAYVAAYKAAPNPVSAGTLAFAMKLVREENALHSRSEGTSQWCESKWLDIAKRWPLDTPLHAIRRTDVEDWVRKRLTEDKVSPTTARHGLVSLKRLLKVAVERGALAIDPIAKVRAPKQRQPRRHVLHPSELAGHLAKIRAAGLERAADVVEMAFFTGMRKSELARLSAGDVDMLNGVIRVEGKTGARDVSIAPGLRPTLERILARASTPLLGTLHAIGGLFRKAQGLVKDPRLHPHAMRHSFATALAHAGVTPYVLMKLMGHRSVEQTMIYFHAVGAHARDAVAALSLGQPAPPAPPGAGSRARPSAKAEASAAPSRGTRTPANTGDGA